jgi:hypothetical protein
MRNLLIATAIMAGLGASAAHAGTSTISDPGDDFLKSFLAHGGIKRDALDIRSLTVNFDEDQDAGIVVTATFAGDIQDGQSGFYVLGVDTGSPKTQPAPFADIGEGDINFDDRVVIQKDGSAQLIDATGHKSTLTATPDGDAFRVFIPLSFIPATGPNVTPDDFIFSMWTVSTEEGAPTGHNAFADIVPDSGMGVTAGGVPEPASWALMITGFGLAGASLRARRRLGLARPA